MLGGRCMLFLAKSTTVGHTDVRTERKRKRFRTGTLDPRCRLVGVRIAFTSEMMVILFASLVDSEFQKQIFAAILNRGAKMKPDKKQIISDLQSEIRDRRKLGQPTAALLEELKKLQKGKKK